MAGTYSRHDYEHQNNLKTTIKPVKIEFVAEVSYPIDTNGYDGIEKEELFQEPYFIIKDNRAIAVYGNYPEELFKLKRDGYLAARNLFNQNNN